MAGQSGVALRIIRSMTRVSWMGSMDWFSFGIWLGRGGR